MRGSWSDIRISVTPGVLFFLALMLFLIPVQWVAACVLSIIIHESGHLLAARFLSVGVRAIAFGMTGARIETEPMEPGEELLCAAAGPLAGGILLLFSRWIPMLAVCAFFHTVVNLLPLGNLDGGRILRAAGALLRKIPCKPAEERVQ